MGIAVSLKIGEFEFHECPVEVLEQRSVTGEDGLIGGDVFAAFLIDIDRAFPQKVKKSFGWRVPRTTH